MSDYRVQLREHQLEAVRRAAGRDYYGLFMGMGSGKTLTAYAILRQERCKRVLVVCKPRTIEVDNVWIKALDQLNFKVDLRVVHGINGKQKIVKLKQITSEPISDDIQIVQMSHNSIWRDGVDNMVMSIKWDAIVIDEAHAIKAAGSEVSKFFATFARRQPKAKRYALTGSPMHNSPLDVYGLYRFLDPSIFGTNFNRFRDKYAYTYKNQMGITLVSSYKENVHEIEDELARTGYLVRSRDVLDLPTEHHVYRYCKLLPQPRKVYDNIKKELIHLFDDGSAATTHNILTKATMLQQIANGHVRDDQNRLLELECSKMSLLQDILEDLPTYSDSEGKVRNPPVVIFYRFIHDLHNIDIACGKVGYTHCTLDQLQSWKAGKFDVVCVQEEAGAEAIEMTRAAYVIYWSKVFSLGSYEQSLARVARPDEKDAHLHRAEKTRSVITFVHLVTEDTIEETIETSLAKKEDLIHTLYRAIKEKQK